MKRIPFPFSYKSRFQKEGKKEKENEKEEEEDSLILRKRMRTKEGGREFERGMKSRKREMEECNCSFFFRFFDLLPFEKRKNRK